MTALIRETLLNWPADQATRVVLTVTLGSGHALTDWDSFVLTIREDPSYPRPATSAAARANPATDGWSSVASAAGSISSSTTLTFDFTVPSAAGEHRYAVDIWGVGGAAGDVPLYPATWLTVTARVR